ncbi:MAG: FAD-dependent oxidoreductase, partial [Lentisphaeria bacterium]|nr:FAD-dependent oxidoreductase [Lentisphaeria bacterium]
DILFYTRPAGIIRNGDRIKGIHVAAKDGISCIQAACFIDASDHLELVRHAAPERCIEPGKYDSVFLFSMLPDEEMPPEVCPENPDLSRSRSVWETERTFKLRNGKRTDLRKLTPELRKKYPALGNAFLFRASNSPVPLAVTALPEPVICKNLLAPVKRKAFTFEDHADLIATRMKEGETIAALAETILPYLPTEELLPEEKIFAAGMDEVTCDLLVCGGGTAGAVAAIVAGRKGKDVILWESMDFVGGIGTGGGIPAYYYGMPGGMQDEIDCKVKECSALLFGRHQLSERYNHYFHPLAKMIVLEEMLAEAGVRVEYGKIICGVETSRIKPPMFPVLRGAPQPPVMNRLNAVEAACTGGLIRCRAKTFIDSTGDGDVAVFAGATFSAGREPDAVQHIYSIPSLILNPEMDKDDKGNVLRSYFRLFPFNIDAGYVDACDNWDVSRARRRGILGFELPKYREEFHLVYISAMLGARASRRIRGDYQIGLADQIRASEFPDVIAYSASHYDNHAKDFENESLNALFWSWALDSHGEPIGCEVPYRVMLPYGVENLIIACRAISTDFDASQQLR